MKTVSVNYNDGKTRCFTCGNYYYTWWMLSHKAKLSQKVGCASFLCQDTNSGYQIICSYGSGYDTQIYQVINEHPIHKKHIPAIKRLILEHQHGNGPAICDKCVTRLIKRRDIQLVA